ncbi:branched-chain amino acid aminotransferase [Proteiniclasticum sp. BAD-10]|uniref:branched-chain-amino-acid transaminase n=1 Tax=Proteiniclasticum sediminis TaxID=2804028 RepID=A0A941CNL5_9CLOT|nr:branched-chain amino acid aminotransferase [Proteiniclasticum sediminis]
MQDIRIERTTQPRQKPDMATVRFGRSFSDHMFLMNYDSKNGWHDARIVPYGPIPMEMASMVFHYAQEIFEGLKAYRTAAGKIQLFRPEENIRRMAQSADRMGMPAVDEDMFLEALKTLIRVDESWVPEMKETSLYIRPFMIATDVALGVHASDSYLFCIITCPVGSYYPEGINPVKILIESEDVRAVRGGTGYAKCGGNYGASIRAGVKATRQGFSQVLWLDGVERKYIEEVGAMNIMFKIEGKIHTPALNGSVLPGVTRKSSIELLRAWGYEVVERQISVEEILEAARDGKLEEVWGTGTAAVITPVGSMTYKDETLVIGGGKIGEVTRRLYDGLTGIQWGTVEDLFHWTVPVSK